jgi:hypothetical protein
MHNCALMLHDKALTIAVKKYAHGAYLPMPAIWCEHRSRRSAGRRYRSLAHRQPWDSL